MFISFVMHFTDLPLKPMRCALPRHGRSRHDTGDQSKKKKKINNALKKYKGLSRNNVSAKFLYVHLFFYFLSKHNTLSRNE